MSMKLTAQIVLLARDRTINAGFVAEKTRCPLRNAQRNLKALHDCGILEVDRLREYRDWETDRKSTRLNSSHRL